MHFLSRGVAAALAATALTWAASCHAPTQIEVRVTTDVDCSRVSGVAIAVGPANGLEAEDFTSTTATCTAGTIGSLVVVPTGDKSAEVGIRIVMGLDGKSPKACVDDGYTGDCVVARRALRYLQGTPLTVPVRMEAACIGVPCDQASTCAQSTCVPQSNCETATCSVTPPQKWSPLAAPSSTLGVAVPRAYPFATWTGQKLALWSGETPNGNGFAPDGLFYDRSAWSAIPTPPFALSGRRGEAAAWTGHAFLVWGGIEQGKGLTDGGLYDGTSWKPTSDPTKAPGLAAFAGRHAFAWAWADSVKKLIVWGGSDGANDLVDGAAYDPAFDTWTAIAPSPLAARSSPGSVWVAGKMLVYGGACGANACSDWATYDPSTNKWSSAYKATLIGPRIPHLGVSDGNRAIFWGGQGCPTCPDDSTLVVIDPIKLVIDSYSGSKDPTPRHGAAGFWGSGRLWFWGGAKTVNAADVALNDGASFDFNRGWQAMPTAGAPTARSGHVMVWTGREAIVFGGKGSDGIALGDGAIFGP